MAKVTGTKGNVVSFEVKGIGEVTRLLRAAGKEIEIGADLGVIRAATFVAEEVQDSIAGRKAETKSVDTGRLINSIQVQKLKKAEAKVAPKRISYPGGSNTQEVATILEKGTSKVLPRRHFKNTQQRNKGKIKEIIETEIQQNLTAQRSIT